MTNDPPDTCSKCDAHITENYEYERICADVLLPYHFQFIIPNFLTRNEPAQPTPPRADRPAGGSALSDAAQAAGPGRAQRLDARCRSPLIESIALRRNRPTHSSRLAAGGRPSPHWPAHPSA